MLDHNGRIKRVPNIGTSTYIRHRITVVTQVQRQAERFAMDREISRDRV